MLSVAPGNAEARQSWRTARLARAAAAPTRRERRWRAREPRLEPRARNASRRPPTPQPSMPSATRSVCTSAGRAGDATVKFYEASGLFRSAEVAAQNETTSAVGSARRARASHGGGTHPPLPSPPGARRRRSRRATLLATRLDAASCRSTPAQVPAPPPAPAPAPPPGPAPTTRAAPTTTIPAAPAAPSPEALADGTSSGNRPICWTGIRLRSRAAISRR